MFLDEKDWGSFAKALRRLQSLDQRSIDPKEIMTPNLNKVFPTKEEAYRDAQVRNYKKGKTVDEGDVDQFINDLVDDLLDRI